MPRSCTPATFLATLLVFAAPLTAAQAQDGGLKTINNPAGGQLVYGSLTGQSSLPSAMGFMLRRVTDHFGERPQIGKFFQTKGTDSAATFFNLHAKDQGNTAIAGLVIVIMPRNGATPTAAVLYDDAANFSKSEPAMMKALNNAWQTEATQYAASGPAPSQQAQEQNASAPSPAQHSAPQTMRQTTAGDRSASIGLPQGWQITSVAGGHLTAVGPNGEFIEMAGMAQGIRDPRAGNNMPYGNRGGPILVAPMNGDLFTSYASLVNQSRQARGMPPGDFRLVSSRRIPPQALEAIFEVDFQDGKGMRKGSVRIDPIFTRGVPTWAMSVTDSNAPESVFETSNPTIMAMVHSYSQDRSVIGREQAAVMGGIQAAADRSRANAAAAAARRENSSAAFNAHMNDLNKNSSAFDQHMDDIDRSSKAFQNYTLDRSQLQDNDIGENGARGTFNNRTADDLVKQDPDRFQIINRPDFIRGVDY